MYYNENSCMHDVLIAVTCCTLPVLHRLPPCDKNALCVGKADMRRSACRDFDGRQAVVTAVESSQQLYNL